MRGRPARIQGPGDIHGRLQEPRAVYYRLQEVDLAPGQARCPHPFRRAHSGGRRHRGHEGQLRNVQDVTQPGNRECNHRFLVKWQHMSRQNAQPNRRGEFRGQNEATQKHPIFE